MKSFADWTQEIAESNRKLAPAPVRTWRELELLGEVSWSPNFESYTAQCRSCGEWTPVYCEPEDLDPLTHFCDKWPGCPYSP